MYTGQYHYARIFDYETVYKYNLLLSKIFQRGIKGYVVRLIRRIRYYIAYS